MRAYSVDYCAMHDVSVPRRIMCPDYVLHIGGRTLAGRDDAYVPAATKAFAATPTLGFTVHEIVTDGTELAMRFSEHGRQAGSGRVVAWRGIGLYRMVDGLLAENWVEQDYAARDAQNAGEPTDPIEPPAADPWVVGAVAGDPSAEAVVRTWLTLGDLQAAPHAVVDDGWLAGSRPRPRLADVTTTVDVCWSAGNRVGFHVTWAGAYAGGVDGATAPLGTPVELGASGIATVVDAAVVSVHAVTDRYRAASAVRHPR